MIVLVLIVSWIVVLSLVVGVCTLARSGDAQLLLVPANGEPVAAPPWDAAPEPVLIAARANARVAEGEASFLGSDSVAA